MRSLPGTRIRLSLEVAGMLALAAAVGIAAAGYALFTLAPRVYGLVGSAEMATGVVMQAQNGWALPTVFTLTVFAMTVGLVLLFIRTPKAQAQTSLTPRDGAGALPASFELRSPEKALAEAGKGMLRYVG
ncbi:MAG: hypothetical protein ACK4UY_05525 [Dietzia sp.]